MYPPNLKSVASPVPEMYPPNLKSVALPVPEIRGVAKLQTLNFGEGEAVGGRGWYRSKEHW